VKCVYFEVKKLFQKVERFHVLLTKFHKGTLGYETVENRMKDDQR